MLERRGITKNSFPSLFDHYKAYKSLVRDDASSLGLTSGSLQIVSGNINI